MDLDLYLDKRNRKLVTGPQNSNPFVFPALMQGDTVRLVLHGLLPNDEVSSFNPYVDDPISFTQIKAGLGFGADYPPPQGTFKVRLVGQTQTTAALPYNIAQADILTAINGLTTVQAVSAQGIKLDSVMPAAPNFFLIRWVDPTKTAQFEVVENRIEPLTFARSIVYDLPTGQLQILKLIVAPLAFTDQFAYPALANVTPDSVRIGSGTQNCIQSLLIPIDATGSFSVEFATNSTTIISVLGLNGAADGSSTIAAALNAIYSDGVTRFAATKSKKGLYYVEFVGPLEKTDWPLLGVTMHGQVPIETPKAIFPLDGPALELALHGRAKIELVFELEITDDGGVSTPIQTTVTVVNDMIDAVMNIAADPAWLEKTDPTSVPYDPDGATVTGYRSYVTPIGSGIGVTGTGGHSFIVTHNLGTKNLHVTVRETGGTNLRLVDNSYVTTYLNDSQIRLDFTFAPTDGQLEVIVSSAIAQDLALPAHTHAIADVVGLQAVLDALTGGDNPLDLWPNIPDSKLPTSIPWRNPSGNPQVPGSYRFTTVPDELLPANIARLDADGRLTVAELPSGVPYIDPATGALTVLLGAPPAPVVIVGADGKVPTTAFPADLSQIPGFFDAIVKALQSGASLPPGTIPMSITALDLTYPALFKLRPETPDITPSLARALPAFTNAGNISGAMPAPGVSANKVYAVVQGASSRPARWRAGRAFDDGCKVGCDGRQWFEVRIDGADAWPIEMERELFTVYVTQKMLRAGSRFGCNIVLQMGLIGPLLPTTRARYLLKFEFGYPAGPALSSVNFTAAPISEEIILTSAQVFHSFGVAVAAAPTTGTLSATKTIYGEESSVTAPTASSFVLRASLTHFDIEEANPLTSAGQVRLVMKDAKASVMPPL